LAAVPPGCWLEEQLEFDWVKPTQVCVAARCLVTPASNVSATALALKLIISLSIAMALLENKRLRRFDYCFAP
jgi:hypothetical protein